MIAAVEHIGSTAIAGIRRVQLHGYRQSSPEITRHAAFRNDLRASPDATAAYDAFKQRCRQRLPEGSHAYSDCQSQRIQHRETMAMAALE